MALGKQKYPFHSEAGQILLVVVLVIIVVTTIGLSLASRSITSLRTSTEEAESQKALAAAEAGVERLLENSAPTTEGTTITGILPTANYSATIILPLSATSFLMNGGNSVPKDEGADLWLSDYSLGFNSYWPPPPSPSTGTLTVYWGDDASAPCNVIPAIEIIIVSGSKNSPTSQRYVYDPASGTCSSRKTENHFSGEVEYTPKTFNDNNVSKTFAYSTSPISVTKGLIARVIPLYGSTAVGIEANPALPLQGSVISSTGTSGQTSRKIRVFKGYPQTYLLYLSYGLFVAADK
jgi:type II secretory pathway pseudopilin PulG